MLFYKKIVLLISIIAALSAIPSVAQSADLEVMFKLDGVLKRSVLVSRRFGLSGENNLIRLEEGEHSIRARGSTANTAKVKVVKVAGMLEVKISDDPNNILTRVDKKTIKISGRDVELNSDAHFGSVTMGDFYTLETGIKIVRLIPGEYKFRTHKERDVTATFFVNRSGIVREGPDPLDAISASGTDNKLSITSFQIKISLDATRGSAGLLDIFTFWNSGVNTVKLFPGTYTVSARQSRMASAKFRVRKNGKTRIIEPRRVNWIKRSRRGVKITGYDVTIDFRATKQTADLFRFGSLAKGENRFKLIPSEYPIVVRGTKEAIAKFGIDDGGNTLVSSGNDPQYFTSAFDNRVAVFGRKIGFKTRGGTFKLYHGISRKDVRVLLPGIYTITETRANQTQAFSVLGDGSCSTDHLRFTNGEVELFCLPSDVYERVVQEIPVKGNKQVTIAAVGCRTPGAVPNAGGILKRSKRYDVVRSMPSSDLHSWEFEFNNNFNDPKRAIAWVLCHKSDYLAARVEELESMIESMEEEVEKLGRKVSDKKIVRIGQTISLERHDKSTNCLAATNSKQHPPHGKLEMQTCRADVSDNRWQIREPHQ